MDLDQIVPTFSNPLPEEGVWKPIPQKLYPGQTILAKTFIRPDIQRPYATVSLVKMDMKKLGIGTEAGTYYPGAPTRYMDRDLSQTQYKIQTDCLSSLTAVFRNETDITA